MNTRMRILIVLIILLGCFSCTETEKEYIIEEPQKKIEGSSPGEIEISIDNITDKNASISWEYVPIDATTSVTYEIAINDSVVAYDINQKNFKLTELQSNTSYSVIIRVLDRKRNSSQSLSEFQTMKSHIKAVVDIELDFAHFILIDAISTEDGGVLIAGNANVTLASESPESFLVKLDKNYSKQWVYVFQSFKVYDEGFSSYDAINDLLEISDGSFLIVTDGSITKLSNSGNEIWNYKNSDKTDFSLLKSVIQDDAGEFYFTGMSNRSGSKDISNEYILGKLSEDGKELWFKFGGTTLINQPKEIHIEANGDLLIMGSAESKGTGFDNLSDMVMSSWLLHTNDMGEFINQKLFVNKYGIEDLPGTMVLTEDNNYLLIGTIAGSMPPNGYSNTKQRFLKVTPTGEVLWDKYHYLNCDGGYFPSIAGLASLKDNSHLVLTRDDRGIAIATVSISGELMKHIKLSGYPGCIFIKSFENENYHCISADGRIIMFNHDGYLG